VCILGQGGVVMPSGQDTADFHFSAIAVRNYETMLKVPLARVLVSVSGCHCMAYLRNFSHWLPAVGFWAPSPLCLRQTRNQYQLYPSAATKEAEAAD